MYLTVGLFQCDTFIQLLQTGIQGIQEKFNEVSEDLIFGNCFQIGSGGVGLQWGDFETEAETGRKWE
ncbi:DNA-directed_RNA polymerase subunit A' [Hexamita inflata]|uniref:DNA-directed RNA polymerase subunit A n=1 Tax=Hexamita inflata TaxID=28002 RepID=A0AA86REZ2_9EUKA|nr:DNA-directed RNA polymerase subunit A' [Hexamita inflata]